MYSVDVAATRLDEQDRKILQYILSKEWKLKKALILGAGRGRIGAALALLGFEVVAVDIEDYSKFYRSLSETLFLEKKISFVQGDITELIKGFNTKEFSLVLAQRVLHYVPYKSAIDCVQHIERVMTSSGSLWFAISPMDSDMAQGYDCAQEPIERRFCTIEKSLQKRFNLYAPVCLYSKQEVDDLFATTHLEKQEIYITSFGNIKGHFTKE